MSERAREGANVDALSWPDELVKRAPTDDVVEEITCDGCGYQDPDGMLGDGWWFDAETNALSPFAGARPRTIYCGFCYRSPIGYARATYPGQGDHVVNELYVETMRAMNLLRADVLTTIRNEMA